MNEIKNINNKLDIPFKEFTPGQVIQSTHMNDDMTEIEDKINEIISVHNFNSNIAFEHLSVSNNPHNVTAEQVGTYLSSEIDDFIEDIKNGDLNEKSLGNELFKDESINSRVILSKAIQSYHLDDDVGYTIDISQNTDVTNRYTKEEVDNLLVEKVGEGTYSKEQIDSKFADVQAGQIVDGTIGVDKLVPNIGSELDISSNTSIINKYTKEEVNNIVSANGLPRDWGDLGEVVNPPIQEGGGNTTVIIDTTNKVISFSNIDLDTNNGVAFV